MSRRVSISMDSRDWTALLEHLDRYGHEASTPCGRVREGLRRAMEPKRKPRTIGKAIESHRPRKPSKEEKRESRASIREKCVARANGICECGCGGALTDPTKGDFAGLANVGRPVFDHMWGRGKGRRPEALETCWILRWDCNEARTHNQPDAVTWWKRYLFHCEVHGYAAEAEAARDMIYKLEVKTSLPAAPRTGGRTDG